MKVYASEQIRNVALLSHSGAGKTSLAEAMLFASGALSRRGTVEDGTTASDYDPDEIQHKISLSTSLLPCEWHDTKLNILDTPGYADFVGEVCGALAVADSALLLICGASGLEVGTEQCWKRARDRKLPAMVFVNKLDREHADFAHVLAAVRQRLSPRAVALQMPLGREGQLCGVVDLLSGVTHRREGAAKGEGGVPAELAGEVAAARERLIEAIAETDSGLTDRYLAGDTLSSVELRVALRKAVCTGAIVPVLCGSATRDIGVAQLLDAIAEYLPDPLLALKPDLAGAEALDGDPAALVFKTVSDSFGKVSMFRLFSGHLSPDAHLYNANRLHEERLHHLLVVRGKGHEMVPELHAGDIGAALKLADTATGDMLTARHHRVSMAPIAYPEPTYAAALEPRTRADLDKLGPAMGRMIQEDPTLRWHRDPDTAETILSGLGESHLRVAVERLRRKFGVEVGLGEPKIPYRETIAGPAKAHGRHKRQTGGHGQFGDVWLEVEPLPRGSGYCFVDRVVGGAVPRQFIPAVDKGIQEVLHQGILSGNPVVDIQVALCDGSFHPVDSSEMAFKAAAAIGFRAACEQAHPLLLEPIMEVIVQVPSAMMGDVTGDLNSHRGRILGMEPLDESTTRITAQVPMAEMFRYATTLRSLTQGRATYSMSVLGYEEAPPQVAQGVAAAYRTSREAKEHR